MTAKGWITAFAPASIGNVGVGFDMLGLAIAGAGDRVSARLSAEPGVRVTAVLDPDGAAHAHLSTDPGRNTASIAAAALWADAARDQGIELIVRKGIPLQSGMGSSAASAVAAVVAVNALLEKPREQASLLPFALQGEAFASGGVHADNVAPSLLGGLVLCPSALLPQTVRLNTPNTLSSVLLHPHLQVDTAASRRSLASTCTMQQWLTQQGFLAAFVIACERGDLQTIAATLKDVVIEPQRVAAVACFADVRDAALEAGALGSSLSGSGPSIFAICENAAAPRVAAAMERACRGGGIACESWVSPMAAPGATLETHA